MASSCLKTKTRNSTGRRNEVVRRHSAKPKRQQEQHLQTHRLLFFVFLGLSRSPSAASNPKSKTTAQNTLREAAMSTLRASEVLDDESESLADDAPPRLGVLECGKRRVASNIRQARFLFLSFFFSQQLAICLWLVCAWAAFTDVAEAAIEATALSKSKRSELLVSLAVAQDTQRTPPAAKSVSFFAFMWCALWRLCWSYAAF